MIKIEAKTSRIKPIIATVGASIFACAISVPAFALGTAPVSNQSGAANTTARYDHNAPLAGVQLAGGEGENEAQPQPYYGGEEAEHEHHEEMEHEGRERMHNLGEEGEEHAERLRNKVDEERAEHQRHEMEEHNPYQQGYNEDSD